MVLVVVDKRAGAHCIVGLVRKEKYYTGHLPTKKKPNTLRATLKVTREEADSRTLNGKRNQSTVMTASCMKTCHEPKGYIYQSFGVHIWPQYTSIPAIRVPAYAAMDFFRDGIFREDHNFIYAPQRTPMTCSLNLSSLRNSLERCDRK